MHARIYICIHVRTHTPARMSMFALALLLLIFGMLLRDTYTVLTSRTDDVRHHLSCGFMSHRARGGEGD